MVNLYISELTAKCDKHNMFRRIDNILRITDYMDVEDFTILMNSWGIEFMELMLHSEKEVSKFLMGHIEWSPTIGTWLSQRWLLKWIRKWIEVHGVPDPRNMFQESLRLNIPDPRSMNYKTLCTHILVANNEIWSLAKDAPVCKQHL